MTASETLSTTYYLRLPFDILLAAKLSAVAIKLCLYLARFTSQTVHDAFVPIQTCANEFGCSVRQIERMLQALAKLRLIELTGHNERGKPTVKVLWWGQDPEATEQKNFDAPRQKSRPIATKTSEDTRQKGRIKKQEDKQTKEQQQPIELCELGKELHALTIAKPVVVDLISRFGKEACERQLEHLRYLKEQGAKIRNKAAWLIKAIKNDYPLPEDHQKHLEQAKKLKQGEQKRDVVYREAVQKYKEGKYDEAKKLAQKRQKMQYDFHIPSAKLIDKCFSAVKKLEKTK